MKKVKRLYSEFEPEHYELFLSPDREKATFSGKVIINGRKTSRPSHRLTLHQKDLKIKSAKVIKKDKRAGPTEITIDRINTQKSFDELRLHSKEQLFPGEYQIELEFSGKISDPMHGIYPCNFTLNGKKKQLIATQFESHHAREAFPCIDEPEAKATFSLSLSTPAAEKVVSNTPIKSQKKKGSQLITEFEKTPRMSTYLLAFAYGELDYKESQTKNNVSIKVYATPDKVNLTDFALNTAVNCLEFFEDYYGVPYPLPKLDLVSLPDFTAAAMENWGMVTFRESYLLVDEEATSIETKQFVAMVIAHELSHQWFGNLVTMTWWDDLWLNESFANLMEYRAVDEMFPEWNIWGDFVQREVGAALSRDALLNVQAVQTQVNHPDELATLFDPSIVYAKGGSLLNMVRHLIGEAAFRKGLKNYFEEFKYSNTKADDLWRHLKDASGTDIGEIMKNWLQKPGYPVIEVDMDTGNKQFMASQKRLVIPDKEGVAGTIWTVPLAASQTIDKSMLEKRSDTFIIKKATKYPLTLNHDGHSYFVSQYTNPEHFKAILEAVKADELTPIDRLLLVQNYLLLEKAGWVSTMDNLQLLEAYAGEREETVWGMLAGIIGNARNLIDKDLQLEKKLNNFMQPLIKPLANDLGWNSHPTDPAETQKLRALALSLAAVAEDKTTIEEGLKRFKQFKKPADLAPDIRSVVYFIGVRYGQDSDFEKLLKLYGSLNNADEKDEVAAELTATRDEKKIKSLLAMIKTDVRAQDVPTWFAWLIRNRYATDQAWQWLKDNWDWIDSKFGTDKSYDRFPRYAGMVFSYPKQLNEYRLFFEPKSNVALQRVIKLGIEEIEGRIAWRQANEKAVKDWLANLVQ